MADADVSGRLTQSEVNKTVDFCLNAFQDTTAAERQKVLDKLQELNGNSDIPIEATEDIEKFTEEELRILKHIRARQMFRMEDTFNLNHFSEDAIEGYAPNIKRGSLGLVARDMLNSKSKLEAPVVDLLAQVEAEPIAKEQEPVAVEADPMAKKQEPVAVY
jgi:flavine halogenase